MARGVVVIYFCRLGGRLHTHQEVMLAADAKAIAALKRYDFGGLHLQGQRHPGHVFFVPDDTLLQDEARALGIRGPNDLYGGVVPHPFVKTKAITHALVDAAAERPEGWSDAFAERVRDVVLPGYTVFSAADARRAAQRLPAPMRIRTGIAQAKLYDETMREYAGFLASRRNYDIGQGVDGEGEARSGVLESSWRVVGATGAEAVALAAFMRDPELHVVAASHVAEFGLNRQAPAAAIIHFQGEDPRAGPMIRYTLVTRMPRAA